MQITVIGTGYVGLVTGTCFAETGAKVICVDNNSEKIEQLRSGVVPIYEPGLETMMVRNSEKGLLSFSTSVAESVEESEVIFIAVGTPPGEDGSADLSYVLQVAGEIGRSLPDYAVIVNKSTVPVGTAGKVKEVVRKELDDRGVDIDFDIASNPEFLKEGAAIQDFLRPDRIVIGVDSERAGSIMRSLYKPFMLNNHPILFMDIASAELTKYASNAMLATRISFINEIANLCEMVGADINQVRKGVGSDSRIGNKFIYAGVGYGGSCFPKDVKALIRTAATLGCDLNVVNAVEKTNNSQKRILAAKVRKHLDNSLKGKTIALWGLSFKPQTDDVREAPSFTFIDEVLSEGASVIAYDPAAMEETRKVYGDSIRYAGNPYDACSGADALVLVTEWPEFRLVDFKLIAEAMRGKVLVDGRNIYDPEELKTLGFIYEGIGR